MGRTTVQIIQNFFKQEIPTIILSSEKQKYIINMPTCFQRFIKDHKQKFPKGSVIFFTKASTDTLAGLSGFMLTIFESKICQETKLYVNNCLYKYLEEVRYKMGFKILPYSYTNLQTGQTRTGLRYTDKVFSLLQNPSYPQLFSNMQPYLQQLPAQQLNQSKKLLNQHHDYQDADMKIVQFEVQSCGENIMNFICFPGKLEGKVLMDKVKELKVPAKFIAKLVAEGSLVLEDGTVVRAEQIKEPMSASPNVMILHYNSCETIQQILLHPKFKAYMQDPQNYTQAMIHIVENPKNQPPILQSKQFQHLLSLFPKKVKHIVCNRRYGNKNYDLTKQPVPKHIQLVSFVSEYFPQAMPNIMKRNLEEGKMWAQGNFLEDMFPGYNVLAAKKCYELVLAPKKGQGYFPMSQSPNQKQKKQFVAPAQIKPAAEFVTIETQQMFKQINPEIVFLGTGSMKPSKYRNVSSIYIEMTNTHSIVLDCGQGSYYQLFNHFGCSKIRQILLKIQTIFITHIHSDHNLGILDLIAQRNKILRHKYHGKYSSHAEYNELIKNEKLVLIIPYNVLPWFNSYVTNIQNLLEGCEVLFVQTLLGEALELSNATVSKDQRIFKASRRKSQMKGEDEEIQQEDDQCDDQNQELEAYYSPVMKALYEKYSVTQKEIHLRFIQKLQDIGISDFQPIHVDHCPQSFAIVITHKSGLKISYSGDCRPSEQFSKAAFNSTLMIHQATFGDDLQLNAVANKHSTVGQAIELAMQSKSWKLALTHFSQRYISCKQIVDPSLYRLNEAKKMYATKHCIVCFDHLRMRASQLPLMVYQSKKICEIFPSDSME